MLFKKLSIMKKNIIMRLFTHALNFFSSEEVNLWFFFTGLPIFDFFKDESSIGALWSISVKFINCRMKGFKRCDLLTYLLTGKVIQRAPFFYDTWFFTAISLASSTESTFRYLSAIFFRFRSFTPRNQTQIIEEEENQLESFY